MEIIENTQTMCTVKDLEPGDVFKCEGEYFIKAYFDYDALVLNLIGSDILNQMTK